MKHFNKHFKERVKERLNLEIDYEDIRQMENDINNGLIPLAFSLTNNTNIYYLPYPRYNKKKEVIWFHSYLFFSTKYKKLLTVLNNTQMSGFIRAMRDE